MTRFSTLVASVLLLAACADAPTSDQGGVPPTVPGVPPTTAPRVAEYEYDVEITPPEPERRVYEGVATSTLPEGMTLVAMAYGDVPVYERPHDAEPIQILPATTILGTATVLTVVDGPDDGWARVMLPVRPNGSEGWVDTSEMLVYVVEGRVVVDLSDLTLTYYEEGEVVLETSVAIGGASHPTPTGNFFVTDNVTLADPGSPWGPHALGLSARSDVITEFNGGDGIIGIHGTNKPGSIGEAVSLGCVRVPNEVVTQLHEMVPIGTPVEIRT